MRNQTACVLYTLKSKQKIYVSYDFICNNQTEQQFIVTGSHVR